MVVSDNFEKLEVGQSTALFFVQLICFINFCNGVLDFEQHRELVGRMLGFVENNFEQLLEFQAILMSFFKTMNAFLIKKVGVVEDKLGLAFHADSLFKRAYQDPRKLKIIYNLKNEEYYSMVRPCSEFQTESYMHLIFRVLKSD